MSTNTMKGVGVIPKKKEVRLVAHPEPNIAAPNELKIRTLEVGVCGTDREICTFAYGQGPAGYDYLVLGHECLGEVVEVGPGVKKFKPGDLVVPSVRRPCPDPNCIPCREGRQDFCFTSKFKERGINQIHGFMTEQFVEEETYLTRVPKELRDVAVMAEPLTIAEKGLAQAWQVQKRVPGWEHDNRDGKGRGFARNAVVLGAGPIGLLGAMKLLIEGFRVFMYSRSPKPNFKADIAEQIGAEYISVETSVEDLAKCIGNIDLVYEAVGDGHVTFEMMRALGINGVFIMTGIPSERQPVAIFADSTMRNITLRNLAIVGTVNASPEAFMDAIQDLGEFKRRWPKALSDLITGRFGIDAYRELLLEKANGIKNVITFGCE